MNLEKIFYIQLKLKGYVSKGERKIKIKNKEEVKLIINGIVHYKYKTLLDLLCEYQLEIHDHSNEIVKIYDVGLFMNNKKSVLVRDRGKDEDYVVVGDAASSIIRKYAEQLVE